MSRTVAVLLVEGAPDDGEMIPLFGGTNRMGREATNEVVVNDAWVSRRHAKIVETEAGHYVRDLVSAHGTFVNGEKIGGRHPLADGDRIQLGPSKVVFVFRSDWT